MFRVNFLGHENCQEIKIIMRNQTCQSKDPNYLDTNLVIVFLASK